MSAIERANALLARTNAKKSVSAPAAKKTVEFKDEVETKPPTPAKAGRSTPSKSRTPSKTRGTPSKSRSTPGKTRGTPGKGTPAKKVLKKRGKSAEPVAPAVVSSASATPSGKDYKAMAYESGVRLASSEGRARDLERQLQELKNFGAAEAEALRKDLEAANKEVRMRVAT